MSTLALIILASGAYGLNALAMLIDKWLLSDKDDPLPPGAYVLMVCGLGALVLIGAPWWLTSLNTREIFLAAWAGLSFVLGLWTMYTALNGASPLRVSPVIGALSPILVASLAYLFSVEQISENLVPGIIILIIASAAFAFDARTISFCARCKFQYLIFAAMSFGLSTLFLKLLFNSAPFLSGFLWSRLFAAVGAAFFLFSPVVRRWLAKKMKWVPNHLQKSKRRKFMPIFFLGQGLGAASFILVSLAVSLGSVSLVNSLQGVQYGILFTGSLILAKLFPRRWQEHTDLASIVQKIVGLIILAVGLWMIVSNI